jgi:hypothetical protein
MNDYLCSLHPKWDGLPDRDAYFRWAELIGLIFMQRLLEDGLKYVLFPATIVGYGCYAIDLLYKRLRKRGAKQTAG